MGKPSILKEGGNLSVSGFSSVYSFILEFLPFVSLPERSLQCTVFRWTYRLFFFLNSL